MIIKKFFATAMILLLSLSPVTAGIDSLIVVAGARHNDSGRPEDKTMPLGALLMNGSLGPSWRYDALVAGYYNNAEMYAVDPWAGPFPFRWDLQLEGSPILSGEDLYLNGLRQTDQEVDHARLRFDFGIRHPHNEHWTTRITYGVGYEWYGRGKNLRADFVLPKDTLIHGPRAGIEADYREYGAGGIVTGGWRAEATAGYEWRSDLSRWGTPAQQTVEAGDTTGTLRALIDVSAAWPLFTDRDVLTLHLSGAASTWTDRFNAYHVGGGFADLGMGAGNIHVRGFLLGEYKAQHTVGANLEYRVEVLRSVYLHVYADGAHFKPVAATGGALQRNVWQQIAGVGAGLTVPLYGGRVHIEGGYGIHAPDGISEEQWELAGYIAVPLMGGGR